MPPNGPSTDDRPAGALTLGKAPKPSVEEHERKKAVSVGATSTAAEGWQPAEPDTKTAPGAQGAQIELLKL